MQPVDGIVKRGWPYSAFHVSRPFWKFHLPDIAAFTVFESGKVVSPTHRPSLPHRKYSW